MKILARIMAGLSGMTGTTAGIRVFGVVVLTIERIITEIIITVEKLLVRPLLALIFVLRTGRRVIGGQTKLFHCRRFRIDATVILLFFN